MSYPIGQKINPYQQTSMGTNGINTPQIPSVDSSTLTQGIVQNSPLKGVSENSDEGMISPKTLLISLPVWVAMFLGMDKFNKHCGGDYKSSVLGRLSEFGDTVGKKLSFLDTIAQKTGVATNYFRTKIVPKSAILSAFFNTPAQPKHDMVLTQANGTKSEVASNAVQKLQQHLKSGGTLKGTTTEELETLSKKAHTKEGIDRIVEICKDQGPDAKLNVEKAGNLRKIPFIGEKLFKKDIYIPFADKLSRNNVCFSEFANKIETFTNSKATTSLGKSLPKVTLRILEGLTNGTAGGKGAMLMGSYFVADAIKKAMEAPSGNGEKRKTFAENLIYNVGWYMTLPLGLGILYKSGGLKYTGMTPEQVESYRNRVKDFNVKVENSEFTKEQYKAEKKAIKELLKGDEKGIKAVLHKPLKWAAGVLTTGLESFKPFIAKDEQGFSKAIKGAGSKIKGFSGGAGRFAIFMFIIAPFLGKLAAKGSHIVFGKPAKSVLDEGNETKPAKPLIIPPQDTELQQFSSPKAEQPQAPIMQPLQQNNDLAYNQQPTVSRENFVATPQKTDTTTGRTMVLNQEGAARTYVPSSDKVVIYKTQKQLEQEARARKADAKAEKSENYAGKYIRKED